MGVFSKFLLQSNFVRNETWAQFVRDRFGTDVSFTASLKMHMPPTFANLFDVTQEKAGKPADNLKAYRKILQSVASAYYAGK